MSLGAWNRFGCAALVLLPIAVLLFVVWVLVNNPFGPSDSDVLRAAHRIAPIVESIYKYRAETGLYPERIEDLLPLGAWDAGQMRYEWAGCGQYISLRHWDPSSGARVTYEIREEYNGWSAKSGLRTVDVAVPVSAARVSKLSEGERYRAIVQEIERRIQRSPNEACHHQGLISHRLTRGDIRQALQEAARMHDRGLSPWWVLQVAARILNHLGQDNWAEKEMRKRADAEPTFGRFFCLAWYYKDTGNRSAALEALSRSSRYHSLQSLEESNYTSSYAYQLAATYAYRSRDYDLTIELCRKWAYVSGDSSKPSGIRAAALLAKGMYRESQVALQEALAKPAQGWDSELGELRRCVEGRDSDFQWDPDPHNESTEYELTITYR